MDMELATKYGEEFAQFYLQIRKKVYAKADEELEARLPELLSVYQETKQQQNQRVSTTPPPSESGTTSGTECLVDDQPLEDYQWIFDQLGLDANSTTIVNGYQVSTHYQEQPVQSNEEQQQTFDETDFVQQFESVEHVLQKPTTINQDVFIGSNEPDSRSTTTSGLSINENQPQQFGLQTVASTSTNVSSQAPSDGESSYTPYIADYPEYVRPGPSTGISSPIQQSIQPTAQQNVISADQDQVNKQVEDKQIDPSMVGNVEFICKFNTCGKVFSTKSDLKRHWVTHFDCRPYICKYDGCNCDFKDRNTTVAHIRAVHFNMVLRGPEKNPTKPYQEDVKKYLHVDRDMLKQIYALMD